VSVTRRPAAGGIVPAGMVAASGFIDCTQWPGAISFMTVGLAFCGFQYNGFLVNHLDLAPPFAGVLMGIGNALGTTARFWQQSFHGIVTSTSEVARVYRTHDTIRYDTIRDAVLTCARNPTCTSQLNLQHGNDN